MRLLRWASAMGPVGLGILWVLTAPAACGAASAADGGGTGDEAPGDDQEVGPDEAGEPTICTEFTEAGAPCAVPSPVRCFAECLVGGCFCSATAEGPRWRCVSDFSCMPDCAPIDDACSSTPVANSDAAPD